jgi:hypothetical protein
MHRDSDAFRVGVIVPRPSPSPAARLRRAAPSPIQGEGYLTLHVAKPQPT